MKNSKNGKTSGIVIFFYIVSVLLLVLTCYSVVSAVQQMKSYAEQYGASLSDMKGDLVAYIIQQAAPYLTYAILVFGIALILKTVQNMNYAVQGAEYAFAEEDEEELSLEEDGEAEAQQDEAEETEEAEEETAGEETAEGESSGDDENDSDEHTEDEAEEKAADTDEEDKNKEE
ncbi:MAG: hypothetical protein ACOYJJ_01455 [Anaerovoracaceae bacterium]|jgi:hypothetical protein